MADKTIEEVNIEREDQLARGSADDYWWLIVRNPAQEIHLYELGYAEQVPATDDVAAHEEPLSHERSTQILAELGGPAPEDISPDDVNGWRLQLAPGRPERYLEPKAYQATGELMPIQARPGVTLHLLPDTEPGTPENAE